MISLSQRLSPLHDALESLNPRWGAFAGMPVPLDFGDPTAEQAQARTLALCDVSALPRTVSKGPATAEMLREQGVGVPEEILQCLPLPGGGLIGRTGASEFFLEDGYGGNTVAKLDTAFGKGQGGVYRVLRQDAALLLAGSQATEVLAQTCGFDFRQAETRLAMTRVAGVSCTLLPRYVNGLSVFQLWLDGSYGAYLWETLLAIARELGGGVAGWACFFPVR
jgi:sarcosine oxidase subunit gamma